MLLRADEHSKHIRKLLQHEWWFFLLWLPVRNTGRSTRKRDITDVQRNVVKIRRVHWILGSGSGVEMLLL